MAMMTMLATTGNSFPSPYKQQWAPQRGQSHMLCIRTKMMDSLLESALQMLENAKKNVKSTREKLDSSIEKVMAVKVLLKEAD